MAGFDEHCEGGPRNWREDFEVERREEAEREQAKEEARQRSKDLAQKWLCELTSACPDGYDQEDFAERCKDELSDEIWERFTPQAEKDAFYKRFPTVPRPDQGAIERLEKYSRDGFKGAAE